MKLALFGDLSGHLTPFLKSLEALGVDLATARLPENLTVIQVGDLIHKGPDSNSIIEYVDQLILENPSTYVQLFGNHEAEHIGGPGFWNCDCTEYSAQTLRTWYRSKKGNLAAAIKTTSGELLVTHSGLGKPMWRAIGKPSSALEAAYELNLLLHTNQQAAFRPGEMLGGYKSTEPPGVCWALCTTEVYGTWNFSKPPFGQVHGHTIPWSWYHQAWQNSMPSNLRTGQEVDPINRIIKTTISNKPFYSIDPGFSSKIPTRPHNPLILEGTVLT